MSELGSEPQPVFLRKALHINHTLVACVSISFKEVYTLLHVSTLETLDSHTWEAAIIEEREAHCRMPNTEGTKDLRWQEGGWKEKSGAHR